MQLLTKHITSITLHYTYWVFYSICYVGSFTNLNAEDIDTEVSDMWRVMYKLTKTLGEQPGPRNVADRMKGKIDKFKAHLPILHTICNPGIRDRHWDLVCILRLF